MLEQIAGIAMQNPILTGGAALIGGTILISLIRGLLGLGLKIAKVGGVLLLLYGGIQYIGLI